MNSKTKRYDLTVWNMVQVPVMGIRKDPKVPQSLVRFVLLTDKFLPNLLKFQTHWVASYPRTMLFPSTYALPNYLHKHYKIHHYLLDDDDMLAIKHITDDTPGFKWTNETVNGFASLENFMRLVLTVRALHNIRIKKPMKIIDPRKLSTEETVYANDSSTSNGRNEKSSGSCVCR